MIDLQQATAIAERHIAASSHFSNGELELSPEDTITLPYGWVFYYDSALHRRTGLPEHAIAGNSPILILSHDGELILLGTARSTEEALRLFELQRGLR